MKLKREELKNQGKVNTEVSEITKGDLIEVFGVTKNQMVKAVEILGKDKNTKNSGSLSGISTSARIPSWHMHEMRTNLVGIWR